MRSFGLPPPGTLPAARKLAADAVTAEVVGALRAAGVRALLLKGPAIAEWLYSADELRSYSDSDLLVAPRDVPASEEVLSRLGFVKFLDGVEIPRDVPALAWTRRRDGAIVDLHARLTGAGAEPAAAWRILSEETERIAVGAAEIEILGRAARTLHVALHAAQHGHRERKPLDDLARALERVPRDVWAAAATLAERLEARPAFAAGLRLLPAGAALAADLRLPSGGPIEVALHARSAPAGAFALQRLVQARGISAKAVVILRALAPPSEHMRAFVPLARRGLPGLVAAYPWRLLRLARRLLPALAAWRRARREAP